MAKALNITTHCSETEAKSLLKTLGFRSRKGMYYRKRKIPDINRKKNFTHDKATIVSEGVSFQYDYKQS